jgi:hypothetical protein
MSMAGWKSHNPTVVQRPPDCSELRYVYVVRTVLGAFVQAANFSFDPPNSD